MAKKRAARRPEKDKGSGSMRLMRGGLKHAAGAVEGGGRASRPTWTNWVLWCVLAVAAALLLSRALT